ncbi:tetratricopeptide repeat protein [Fodinibius salsisoli]|uniref:Tetratricopeptide repeat-containing protein n=1 Tax=Fodinibius salsisoli TaxID=2820877 RepID=A0ABT3PI43_9BACT|nr:hypothetical protein [Fodinibius salsisoli]MCW9705587.1 hypothetical protein [Fodinibius salsisoli]
MVRNKELEKQIDAYIKGHLDDQEAQELWENLFENPEYIELLNTEIGVQSILQEDVGQPQQDDKNRHAVIHTLQNSWKWVVAVAAVVIVAVAINVLELNTEQSLNELALKDINLSENLASAPTLRSVQQQQSPSDSLLNLGFKAAISGDISGAVKFYDMIIMEHPEQPAAVQAHMNKGIIQFNDRSFEGAIASFKQVTRKAEPKAFILEKGYWYLGNAYINTDSLNQAHTAIEQVYSIEGIYYKPAIDLLKKLDEKLGNPEREYDF